MFVSIGTVRDFFFFVRKHRIKIYFISIMLIFPNLVNILGTQLAVRIVALAGNLSKLARMPASTIQLLPILIFVIVVQKFVVSGLTAGSVKM